MCGGENHASLFSSVFYFLPLVCMHLTSACAYLLFVTCDQGLSMVFLGRNIAFPTSHKSLPTADVPEPDMSEEQPQYFLI